MSSMLVTSLIATAVANTPTVMEERVVIAQAIDALFSGELDLSESLLSSVTNTGLMPEVSFWLAELNLRAMNFDAVLSGLSHVGEAVDQWRVALVEVEALVGQTASALEYKDQIEAAWQASGGDPRGFGAGACLSYLLFESGEVRQAGEVLRAIGGDPQSLLPSWLQSGCFRDRHLLAIEPYPEGTGVAAVTVLGERWEWFLDSGLLVTLETEAQTACPLPDGYALPPDTVDLSFSCVREELWFIRHRDGASSLWRFDGGGEVSFDIGGMAPATVSAHHSRRGTELLLGGVVSGEPVVAIWDAARGLREISTGAWFFTAPVWR